MTGYFITGTDTGVGKTHVTASLARCARSLGKKVFAFKPIETGCEAIDGHLVGSDQQVLWRAAGSWQQGDLRGVYMLRSPVAPLVAAEEEQVHIDFDRIQRTLEDGASQADVTLVEGAGGWRVPLTPEHDINALAKRIGFPLIVVSRATLGTINHSLLTVEAAEREGCKVAALVLSRRPEESEAFAENNARQIRRRWKGNVLVLCGDESVFCPLFE
jgi:dethiobiotin synthetase